MTERPTSPPDTAAAAGLSAPPPGQPYPELVQLVDRLQRRGLDPLVMGGHAVRHYGVIDRTTSDFDFKIGPDDAERLRQEPRLLTPDGPAGVGAVGDAGTAVGGAGVLDAEHWRSGRMVTYHVPTGRQVQVGGGAQQDVRRKVDFWIDSPAIAADQPALRRRAEVVGYGLPGGGTVQVAYLGLSDLIDSPRRTGRRTWRRSACSRSCATGGTSRP